MNSLLLLRALTPIHAGAGRGMAEHVDLPVQRDEFGFPCIWASSLKGALRGTFTRLGMKDDVIRRIFGPEPLRGYEGSGLASFLDARLLLMPTRSLRGVWTYVTSPHMLYYLVTYLEGLGEGKKAASLTNALRDISTKEKGKLEKPVISKEELLIKDQLLMLNEVEIPNCEVSETLPDVLFKDILQDALLNHIKVRGVIVVNDDLALNLVERSMMIQYRVRLRYDTKTVESGALWSEEYIPQETILVSGIIYKGLMNDDHAHKVYKQFISRLKHIKYVWLGGKETIGKGLLRMYIVGGANA